MSTDLEPAGALATAALVAAELQGEAGKTPAPHAGHDAKCANCGTQLVGAYCHSCGQAGHVHRSLLHIGEELLHGILHFDTRSWRTLPLLVARPGLLTRRYIDGQRSRYVSPLALFLFSVFLMFFVYSFVGAPGAKGDESSPSERPTSSRLDKALEPTKFETDNPTLAKVVHHTLENPDLALYKLKSSAYKFAFLLVPISLPFLWLLFFWRPGVTTYDHAIFLLFSLSFMSLWQTFIVVLSRSQYTSWLIGPALFYVPVHIFLQVKETYGVDGWGATWRTFALMFAGFFVFLLYVVAILAISLH